MKNIKFIFCFIFVFFISSICVYASCTNEEILVLKDKVKDIKVTYKHLGLVEEIDGNKHYNSFDVTVKNVDSDLYLSIFDGDTGKLNSVDDLIKLTLDSGNWSLSVYSNECDVLIGKIDFRLPKFNIYSLDPLCEGIDDEDFKLCGKYYESYVSYDDFVTRVNYYLSSHEISNTDNTIDEKKNITDIVINFITKYKMYFIFSIVFILFTLFIFLIIRKRKRRGVLQ